MRCSLLLAYIDPMSGTILLQVILGGLLGGLALFRRQVARLLGWVGGRRPAAESPENSARPADRREAA
jgi:hypothetical protein